MNFVIHGISFMTYLSRWRIVTWTCPTPLRYPFEMSDAAPLIAPALLVAYLAIGCLLFWGRAARP
jgi:hypothetical protein